jgi:hypothetical protein
LNQLIKHTFNGITIFVNKISGIKKLLFAPVISLMIEACSDKETKEDASSTKDAEMKALYEKNLATIK